jgi:hypothetical protein
MFSLFLCATLTARCTTSRCGSAAVLSAVSAVATCSTSPTASALICTSAMPAVSGLSRTNAMDTNVITVEVQKLDLKPGDILALRVDRSLDKTQLDAMRAGLEAIRPEGVKVVILDSACQLQIIKSPNTMITLEGSKI